MNKNSDKKLIVVDMQVDFINGSLGTAEAEKILPNVVKRVNEFEGEVLFTFDTHQPEYLSTQEGRNLPVEHCIRGTEGWELPGDLKAFCDENQCRVYEKPTFGSVQLASDLKAEYDSGKLESVELIGLCTDICVVSNALMLKAFMPELPISVRESCCAGVTPQKHDAAIETMSSCQIQIV